MEMVGENVSESGVGDTSVLEAVEITETHSSTVEGEENGSCKIEGEVREERGYGVVSSSSVGEDAIQVENVNVEVKVDIVNDLLPHKKPGNVSPKVSSKGVENQAMEINDEQAKKSKCQNKDATTFDERVLQENENLEANDLNLLVDLEPYMGANGNAEMDSKEAELNVGDLVWGKKIVSSKGVENQAMEIKDEQAKKSKCQNKDATSFDERVLQKNKNLKANGLNLLADLESYMGADGNAKMASKEAELKCW
ncbi:hypothetical protein OIU85_000700 [Salix viminalis]|uniref:Uncharacterized protein n=1 Tax=Salix viminalis TaxID=40686 RepID=A0A9Q0VK04_SALVM|nr:hypothetical protein OIU85_000700 [Salix viminalis]